MLRFGLMGGVTSVRDMGGDDIVLAQLAKKAAAADKRRAAHLLFHASGRPEMVQRSATQGVVARRRGGRSGVDARHHAGRPISPR